MTNECNHDFVTYKQCCYCGAYDNGKEVIDKRTQSNVEDLRQKFGDWYFGIKEDTGNPPLAMQIFYWFEKNVWVFNVLNSEQKPDESAIGGTKSDSSTEALANKNLYHMTMIEIIKSELNGEQLALFENNYGNLFDIMTLYADQQTASPRSLLQSKQLECEQLRQEAKKWWKKYMDEMNCKK